MAHATLSGYGENATYTIDDTDVIVCATDYVTEICEESQTMCSYRLSSVPAFEFAESSGSPLHASATKTVVNIEYGESDDEDYEPSDEDPFEWRSRWLVVADISRPSEVEVLDGATGQLIEFPHILNVMLCVEGIRSRLDAMRYLDDMHDGSTMTECYPTAESGPVEIIATQTTTPFYPSVFAVRNGCAACGPYCVCEVNSNSLN